MENTKNKQFFAKIAALGVAFALCLSALIAGIILHTGSIVRASTAQDVDDVQWHYTVIGDYVRIDAAYLLSAYPSGGGHIDVPAELGGLPVRELANQTATLFSSQALSVFRRSNTSNGLRTDVNLKKVTLPEGITRIGIRAFQWCQDLEEIVLPESLTIIDSGAFWNCSSLTELDLPSKLTTLGYGILWNTKVEHVTIPATLQNADTPFINSMIRTVTLTDGLTKIYDNLFFSAAFLENIGEIPPSVTSIGSHAFTGCISLGDIIIPETVTAINSMAFGMKVRNIVFAIILLELQSQDQEFKISEHFTDEELELLFLTGDDETIAGIIFQLVEEFYNPEDFGWESPEDLVAIFQETEFGISSTSGGLIFVEGASKIYIERPRSDENNADKITLGELGSTPGLNLFGTETMLFIMEMLPWHGGIPTVWICDVCDRYEDKCICCGHWDIEESFCSECRRCMIDDCNDCAYCINYGFCICSPENDILYISSVPITDELPSTYTPHEEITLIVLSDNDDEYDFIGWQYNNEIVTEIIAPEKGLLVLRAIWELKVPDDVSVPGVTITTPPDDGGTNNKTLSLILLIIGAIGIILILASIMYVSNYERKKKAKEV